MIGSFFDFDMGVSMLSEVDQHGFVSIQVDAYGEQDSGVEAYEAHFPLGLYARPIDPEKDPVGAPDAANACTTMYGFEGGTGHAWPLQDPRVVQLLPKLKKGGVIVPSAVPGCGFMLWDGQDPAKKNQAGSFTLLVRAGVAEPAAVLSFDLRTKGKETIKIVHWNGNNVELRADGSVIVTSKSGQNWIQVKDDQILLNGDTLAQGTMAVGSPGAAQALVLAEPLFAYLTVLEAVLKAPTGPYAVPPVAALKEAIKTKVLTAS